MFPFKLHSKITLGSFRDQRKKKLGIISGLGFILGKLSGDHFGVGIFCDKIGVPNCIARGWPHI